MGDSFVTFQRYYDLDQINELVGILKEHNIECQVENEKLTYDATFAYNELSKEYRLKLRPQDFDRANKVLEEVFQKQINSVEKDYYLFGFSDEELFEIIAKPDEWGKLDYVLAQKILKDRGKEIFPEGIEKLKSERIKDLSKADKDASAWIVIGYLLAILGCFSMIIGVAGLLTGLIIASHNKTLPDGKRMYAYIKRERTHGWIIFIIGLIAFAYGRFYNLAILESNLNPYF